LFTAPVIILLGVFLVVPVLMALWVSFSDWGGRGSPFSSDVHVVGFDNYTALLSGGGLAEQDFGMSLKNNAWYVVLVVPLQTAVARSRRMPRKARSEVVWGAACSCVVS